jgi:hypothetical protein
VCSYAVNDNLTRATGKKDCIAIPTFADRTSATQKKLLIFLPKPVVGMISIARHMAAPAGTAWGIDAPESNQTCIDGWHAVHIATHYMRGLVATGANNVPIDRLGIARFGAL